MLHIPASPARCRVERLETRIAPASFLVTSLADDGSAGTLRDAVENANASAGPDTITFAPAVTGIIALATGEIEITDALTIQGPGASRLAIDAGGTSRIFKINYTGVVLMPTAISALSLRHGHSTEDGGALFSNETALLDGLVISGSHADGAGGGAYLGTDGQGVISRCRFVGNTAGDDGGGLFIAAGEELVIRKSSFAKYRAAGSGGGVFLQVEAEAGASAVVTSSTFTGNIAAREGGGLRVSNESATKTIAIRSSQLSGNHAGGTGGGLATEGGAVVVDRTLIAANTARFAGGGIADHADTLAIFNSQIFANASTSATGAGGGGLSTSGAHPVLIVASIIAQNRSASFGGGLRLAEGATLALKNSFVTGNAALQQGVNIFAPHGTRLRT